MMRKCIIVKSSSSSSSVGSKPVGVQCPISSSLGEFRSYWDWLWCPGLSPVSVAIARPFAFHTWCFPFALICHWISIVFLLYGRRIATHSVDISLSHYLGEFSGLGLQALSLIPDVVVSEAEPRLSVWVVSHIPNRLSSGGQTYRLAACTRQVTSPS